MSYEFIYEKEGAEKKLTSSEQISLVDKISKNYQQWQDERFESLQNAEKLIGEIFLKKDFQSCSKSSWKTNVKMCKLFMLYQTLKAYIWRNIYSNVNAMFDVSGENANSTNNSNKQKAAICDVLERMNFSKCLDKIIDNSLIYGNLVAFVGWKKHTKQIRRELNLFEKLISLYGDKNYITEEITTYDNPYVYDVNPVNFVFDVSQIENWDSCPKILKSFKTPEEINNNTLYTITQEAKKFLDGIAKNNPQEKMNKDKSAFSLKDDIVSGNTVEVLEHWGNIRLADGELLENMHVVVLGRKYIIRFEKNKFIENPFVFGYYTLDPETKMPVSPLQCIYNLAMLQEKLYSKTVDMQALNENPPIFCPEGFFNESEVQLTPGKILTYDPNLYSNVPITPMKFSSDIYIKDILEIDNIISQVSGIFPNMSGQLDRENATATEVAIKTQGQNIRLSMLLDIINQDLILPIVEKVAALLANFKFEPETVFINKDGECEQIVIDNTVRQGHYLYKYSDRNSYLNKIANTEQIAVAFEKFAQVIPLDWQEIFKWYWEQKGVDNPERFLQKQQPVSPVAIAALANAMSNTEKKQPVENKINPNDNAKEETEENITSD